MNEARFIVRCFICNKFFDYRKTKSARRNKTCSDRCINELRRRYMRVFHAKNAEKKA